eukprot:EG_transcript_12551
MERRQGFRDITHQALNRSNRPRALPPLTKKRPLGAVVQERVDYFEAAAGLGPSAKRHRHHQEEALLVPEQGKEDVASQDPGLEPMEVPVPEMEEEMDVEEAKERKEETVEGLERSCGVLSPPRCCSADAQPAPCPAQSSDVGRCRSPPPPVTFTELVSPWCVATTPTPHPDLPLKRVLRETGSSLVLERTDTSRWPSPAHVEHSNALWRPEPDLPRAAAPFPRPALALLLLGALLLALPLGWAAAAYLRRPATYFCDTEGLYSMTWHLDCDGCPTKGYCAFGELQACEPPAAQFGRACSDPAVPTHLTTGTLHRVQAVLRAEQCSAKRVRGMTLIQLQDVLRPAVSTQFNVQFDSVWNASLVRLQPHPALYGVRSATVAGQPGLEWLGEGVGDRLLCLGQQHVPGMAAALLGLLITAAAAAVTRLALRLAH